MVHNVNKDCLWRKIDSFQNILSQHLKVKHREDDTYYTVCVTEELNGTAFDVLLF